MALTVHVCVCVCMWLLCVQYVSMLYPLLSVYILFLSPSLQCVFLYLPVHHLISIRTHTHHTHSTVSLHPSSTIPLWLIYSRPLPHFSCVSFPLPSEYVCTRVFLFFLSKRSCRVDHYSFLASLSSLSYISLYVVIPCKSIFYVCFLLFSYSLCTCLSLCVFTCNLFIYRKLFPPLGCESCSMIQICRVTVTPTQQSNRNFSQRPTLFGSCEKQNYSNLQSAPSLVEVGSTQKTEALYMFWRLELVFLDYSQQYSNIFKLLQVFHLFY